VSRFQRVLRQLHFMVSGYQPPRRPAFYTDELEKAPRYLPKPKPPIERQTPESPFLKRLRQAVQEFDR
jgi:hypothetical protein